jgi:glycosyltransferase involved in cell wall biosynthesis
MYTGQERIRLEALRKLTDRTLARATQVFILSEQAHGLIDPALLEGAQLLPMAPPSPPVQGEEADSAVPLDAPHEPFLLVIGDLLRYKGVEFVADALQMMPVIERPRVLVVGRLLDRRYVSALQQRIRAAQLDAHLRLIGPASQVRVLELLRRAVACILPSRFENASRLPMEAMSQGTPVIASDIASFRESCGNDAAFFDLADPHGLAALMRRVVADRPYRERLAMRGSRRADSLHPWIASERIVATFRGGSASN